MTWKTESFTDVDANKDREFVRFINLPRQTAHQFELAVNGPMHLLREHGWAPIDAMGVSRSLWDYRDFIQSSRAEFGVAKHGYVAHRSGWFSDRTECYLASGRPALVQDTGWSAHLPSGTGLLAFSTAEEAIAGLDRLDRDYHLTHGGRPRSPANTSMPRASCRGCSRGRAMSTAAVRLTEAPSRSGLRLVAPVATSISARRGRDHWRPMTALLAEGLVARGHDVTLFATGGSRTRPRLHATFPREATGRTIRCGPGSCASCSICPLRSSVPASSTSFTARPSITRCRWLHAGVSVADGADAAPFSGPAEVRLWSRYPEAPFVAVSDAQARMLRGLNVAATIPHAIDVDSPPRVPRAVPTPHRRPRARGHGAAH